jgi:hypothetical protein
MAHSDPRSSAGTAGPGAGTSVRSGAEPSQGPAPENHGPGTAARPNILFILVDELRFPSVFPRVVNNVGEFLHRFMPNDTARPRPGADCQYRV